MSRLAQIEARINSMHGLLEVIGAMRSIAGMRLQEAQRVLPAANRYAMTIADAIAATLSTQHAAVSSLETASQQHGLVVYGAEHGFVGDFIERLLSETRRNTTRSTTLFVLGSRTGAIATEQRMSIAVCAPMATRPGNVPQAIHRLTDELYRRIARRQIRSIDLIYASRLSGGEHRVIHKTLLPLDLESLTLPSSLRAPLMNLGAEQLLEQLTTEYVFAQLAAAAIESLAGENAARFATMTAARENTSRKLDALRRSANEVRQLEITTELLDVVTGAQAMEDRPE